MMAAAMATQDSKVPTYVDLARVGAEVERQVDAATCARLHTAVGDVHQVSAALKFTLDDHGRPCVQGTTLASVTMDCQLCAEPVTVEVSADVDGVLAASDGQAQAWRSADDPQHVVVVAGAELDVVELIEDELLLNLPIRVCADEACPRRPTMDYGEEEIERAASPFEQLAALQNSASSSSSE